MPDFEAKRIHVVLEGQISAPVDQVFPLACPYEEYKWIEGWDCDIIYSDSGRVEDGCIFTEKRSVPLLHDSDDGVTTWYAVLHDPKDFRLHFVLVTGISISKYKIEMEDSGDGTTVIKLDFTLTALNERGNTFIDGGGKERVSAMLTGLGHMMKHYCETGEMLKTAQASEKS
jgi:hypothetical protein